LLMRLSLVRWAHGDFSARSSPAWSRMWHPLTVTVVEENVCAAAKKVLLDWEVAAAIILQKSSLLRRRKTGGAELERRAPREVLEVIVAIADEVVPGDVGAR